MLQEKKPPILQISENKVYDSLKVKRGHRWKLPSVYSHICLLQYIQLFHSLYKSFHYLFAHMQKCLLKQINLYKQARISILLLMNHRLKFKKCKAEKEYVVLTVNTTDNRKCNFFGCLLIHLFCGAITTKYAICHPRN